ncbi:transcription termination factor 2-like [Corticium candelabrum]|uniref:transcription termination factor 2-like n=1 Tax=Corticium candelabrum TaxID=121492 RepID=UPI002E254606|nr:transcription termination factor 2-like [Corticium candelabrum]
MELPEFPQTLCPKHNTVCFLKTGVKPGPNRGRSFYICLKDRDCKFFSSAKDIQPVTCPNLNHSSTVVLQFIKKDKLLYQCSEAVNGEWCGRQVLKQVQLQEKENSSPSDSEQVKLQDKGNSSLSDNEESGGKKTLLQQGLGSKPTATPFQQQHGSPFADKDLNVDEEVVVTNQESFSSKAVNETPSGMAISCVDDDISQSQSVLQKIEASKEVQASTMPTNLLHNSQALVCKDKEPLAEKHVLEKTACIDVEVDKGKVQSEQWKPFQPMLVRGNSTSTTTSAVHQPARVQYVHPAYAAYQDQQRRLYGGKMTDVRMLQVKQITAGAIKDLFHSLETCPTEEVGDPAGLTVPLMKHQREALAWLVWREKQTPPSGILADDMGLGKTLTMISLMMKDNETHRVSDERQHKELLATNATLVVCPASVVMQWQKEIEQRVQYGRLSVYVHHGSSRCRHPEWLTRYDVVITSYSILNVEGQNAIIAEKESAEERGEEVKEMKKGRRKTDHCCIPKLYWRRVILDEGHTIKNHKTSTAIAACSLEADHRWILTGTPLQNDLLDMYSLIKFLRVAPFSELGVWKNHVSVNSSAGFQRLDVLVKSLLLRRTKDQIQTSAIGCLPEKKEHKHSLQLSEIEAFAHWKIFQTARCFLATEVDRTEGGTTATKTTHLADDRFSQTSVENLSLSLRSVNKIIDAAILHQVSEHADTENRGKSTLLILTLILRLQQCCNHLSLLVSNFRPQDFDADDELAQQMSSLTLGSEKLLPDVSNQGSWPECFSEKFASTKIRCLIDELHQICTADQFSKSVVVSQWTSMLGIVETHLTAAGMRCAMIKGSMSPAERQIVVDSFNSQSRSVEVLLLSLRAGGCGLNLIGGNHLFLIDPHWNPALEQQACDRIYRVGQRRNVVIHKFVCQKSIEERLVIVQEKKKAIADRVLTGAKASKATSKLSIEDLRLLFDV